MPCKIGHAKIGNEKRRSQLNVDDCSERHGAVSAWRGHAVARGWRCHSAACSFVKMQKGGVVKHRLLALAKWLFEALSLGKFGN